MLYKTLLWIQNDYSSVIPVLRVFACSAPTNLRQSKHHLRIGEKVWMVVPQRRQGFMRLTDAVSHIYTFVRSNTEVLSLMLHNLTGIL